MVNNNIPGQTQLIKLLKTNIPKELQRDFGLWLRKLFKIKNNDDLDILNIPGRKVNTMLAEKLAIYEKELLLKGRLEGIEKGKLETAKNMLAMSLDLDLIIKVTGLSKGQILKLK